MKPPVPVAVFASGGGTNLQALLDHEPTSGRYRVALVVSDREGAGALERARSAGREACVIETSGRSVGHVARETLGRLAGLEIRVILLAGYLKMIPPAVVAAYERRILNIHPALLPRVRWKGHVWYAGARSRLGLRCGGDGSDRTLRGRRVRHRLDRGAVVRAVRPGDDVVSLAARVLEVEHELYPAVADHLCRAVAEGVEPGPFDVTPDSTSVTSHPENHS